MQTAAAGVQEISAKMTHIVAATKSANEATIKVKEASLAHKPASLTMEEAASIPLVALTAWQALVEKAQLKKGQKVFIQAGSGGVGTFARGPRSTRFTSRPHPAREVA